MSERGKHTPGPWKISIEKDGAREINPENWLGLPNKSRCGLIARVSPWDADENFIDEANANARLIAAAPELLAALKQALSAKQGDWQKGSGWEKSAKAAIAKAEGYQ